MNCPNCGEPLPSGAKFCIKCGAGISPSQETEASSERKRKNKRFLLLIIAGVLMFLGALTGATDPFSMLLDGIYAVGVILFSLWPIFVIGLLAVIAYRLYKKQSNDK